MLLSLMRRHAKSWLIKLLIGIIALVFIFYFGYSFSSKEGVKVAEVNGEIISMLEYQKAYKELLMQLQKEYGSVWNDNLIDVFDLKNRALEDLINLKIMSQEARKTGLDITDQEIRDDILQYPAFQFMGRFDENRYKTLLANNYMKPEDFEATVAQKLLQQKLRQFLLTFLPVTEEEVLDQYRYLNQQVKVGFISFSPDEFKDSVKPDKDGREKYFEEHKEDYRVPDEIRIAYITISPEGFKDRFNLKEEDIQAFYEDNQGMFKEEKQVRTSHILFELDEDASEEEEQKVKEKALAVLEKSRQGQDFSELAKQYSEGPTKDTGGDLGFFSRGRMVKPFEDAAFNLNKGEISDLVRTNFGYHIIKVVDVKEEKVKTLEEAREQITEILKNNESMDLANEKALTLIDQMPYDVDLTQYAREHNVPVDTTDFFSQGDQIPDIGGDQKLRQALFSMQNKDVSELIEFDNRFYIIQVIDRKSSYIPEMGEVSERVEDDFILYLAKQEARSSAEKYLEELKAGKDWKDLAKKHGKESHVSEFFSRRSFPKEIGAANLLQETAFQLTRDRVYPDIVIENERGAFVIRWEESKGIDEEKFKEEKARYSDSILYTKQQAIFNSWLERLKQDADIDRSPFQKYK